MATLSPLESSTISESSSSVAGLRRLGHLPAAAKREEFLGLLRRQRVSVISGDTGCGKSTVMPQLAESDLLN